MMPKPCYLNTGYYAHKMLSFSWILIALCATIFNAHSGGLAAKATNSKTNVVLIVSDNQSPSLLGAYGNQQISTPHIDQLAESGIKYTNAYAASGVCSPTRAALLTGLMPSQTGVHNALPTNKQRIGIEDWSAIEEFRKLPKTMSDAGYQTALIGKYHLGTHDKAQLGFDHWVTMKTGHTKSFMDTAIIKNGKSFTAKGHVTDFWTKEAVDFINNQPSESPFFLMLSYNGPYMLPPVVSKPSQSPYAEQYRKATPEFPQQPVHPFLRNWAINGPTDEHMQAEATHAWAAIGALNNPQSMINTAAETSLVDEGVGRIIRAIEDKGIADNTLIIYTSDQGSAYGQHGLWGNTSWAYPFPAYETQLRIPLIFSHQGSIKPEQRQDSLVSQVDIFPTILNHIGLGDIEIENSPGQVLETDTAQSEQQISERIFFEFITVRGVRSKDWKYVRRFPQGPDELYFLRDDPEETNNLADDQDHKKIRDQHNQMLTDFFAEYSDPQYDLWNGGTGKGRLIEDYGQNKIFKEEFPNWQPPFIRKADTF